MTREADHGQRSDYARSGGSDDQALTTDQRDRLSVIRAELESPQGMIDALRDKSASLALVVEWGQAWLKDKAETDGGPAAFESPMLARWFTAFESFRRSIESLYKMTMKRDVGGLSAGDVLDATRRGDGWVQTDMFAESGNEQESESDDTTD